MSLTPVAAGTIAEVLLITTVPAVPVIPIPVPEFIVTVLDADPSNVYKVSPSTVPD
jgi:hypothetical protein